jgi:thiol peroxidase
MTNKRNILFNGREYELFGEAPPINSTIPDFHVVFYVKGESEGTTVTKDELIQFGYPMLLSVTTSLDTPIGKLQTKKFEEMLSPFSGKALLWSVSSDLPFNINRFFEEEKIEHLSGGSDYLDNSFGRNFGVLIEEVRLLSRAVFVIDKHGVIQYSQIPEQIQTELDYDSALNVLNSLITEETALRRYEYDLSELTDD